MQESILTDEMLSRNNEALTKQLGTMDGVMSDAAAPSEEMMTQIGDLQNAAKAYNAENNSVALNKLTPEQLATMMPRKPKQMVREYAKIGRNEQCPCGSGKKYKNCCQKTGKYDALITADEARARKAS